MPKVNFFSILDQDPNMIAEVCIPEPKPLGERLKKKIIKVKREAV